MHRHRSTEHDRRAWAAGERFGYHCGGRHGGPGSRGFAGGFPGDAGRDGRGFRSGRKLSSDDLQLVMLALIGQKPRHGYEIIKALEELSAGFYVPSPGVVYPSLSYLEEADYLAVEAEGARKLYQLTAEGSAQLDRNREAASAMLAQIEQAGRSMEQFRQSFAGHDEAERGRRHGREGRDGGSELGRARAALKSALFDLRRASAVEEARIAEILDRATAEIREILAEGKW